MPEPMIHGAAFVPPSSRSSASSVVPGSRSDESLPPAVVTVVALGCTG